jgi:hypothetical protein
MEKMTIEQLRNRPYKIPNNILRKGDNPKLSKHIKIEDLKKYWEMHLNFNSLFYFWFSSLRQ